MARSRRAGGNEWRCRSGIHPVSMTLVMRQEDRSGEPKHSGRCCPKGTGAHAKVNTVPSFGHPNDKKQRDFGPCLAIQASPSPDASDSRNNPVNRFCVKGSSGHVREISHHIPRVSPAAAVLQAAVLAAALDLCRKQEKDFPAGQPSRHRSASERDDRAGPPSQHIFSDIGALLTRSMRGAFAARSSAGYRPSGGACRRAIVAACLPLDTRHHRRQRRSHAPSDLAAGLGG